ncbi:excalibur calcium-binding domain-containing protein [Deinococcus koreensis]|uniref:Ligand-binding protein SH3 n=1 Tax=Deinococcus koreensis TaxID=2054903 RepID=A0A2K3UXL1_9DEIO|nr:excalibur calcium-binding domain-containing protein [Deinococcus koreensis]PNY81282.1 ligand-binding protein SH3 [Deinococcus koreensis]
MRLFSGRVAGKKVLALALVGGTWLGSAQAATAYTRVESNLRRVAAPNGLVVGVVPGGTLLTVACSGQWCRTSYQGRGGYVARTLLTPFTRSAPLSGVFYASCRAMRAANKAPIRLGREGYRVGLDSNSNGVACDQGDR